MLGSWHRTWNLQLDAYLMPVLPRERHLVVRGPPHGVDDLLAVQEVRGGFQQDWRGRGAAAAHVGHVHVDEGVGAAGLGVPRGIKVVAQSVKTSVSSLLKVRSSHPGKLGKKE